MALPKVVRRPLNAIEVVSKSDDAIDLENSDWEGYVETLELSKLKMHPNKTPHIFLVNFQVGRKEIETIKNSMTGGVDEEGKSKFALGSLSFSVAKHCLKDIKNPEGLPEDEVIKFKKDQNGYAHDDVLVQLDSFGILSEILALYSKHVLSGTPANAKN